MLVLVDLQYFVILNWQCMVFTQGVLFPIEECSIDERPENSFSERDKDDRRKRLLNLQWHNGFPTEGKEEMPLIDAYNGQLPFDLLPFSDRGKKLFAYGVHCYLDDYKIEAIWNSPSRVLDSLRSYSCVIAPDYSIFVDQPRAINVWNVYRNRWVSSYWQKEGISVVPSASWGNVDSFDYCFDGLPKNSTIAVGHTAVGRDKYYRKLYRLGVEELIIKKRPTRLIVYGAPLDFAPDVETVYYEGIIQKLRRL